MRPRDVGTALEAKRGNQERINNAQAQPFKIHGTVDINNTGESVIALNFPVMFIEMPISAFGAFLSSGQAYLAGAFPTWSATILRWDERGREDGTVIYAGATLGVVADGVADQVLVIQWQMEGIGLRGPTPDE